MQNVVVSVGTITTRDVKLEIGAANEQVTVEAGQQIVETEDSALIHFDRPARLGKYAARSAQLE